MPAVSKFIDGTGPVFSGNLFPFLFITIACGAVSGFHALVSSGTTPKMIEQEGHAQPIGYGAMLMESFVAAMAMIAACVLTRERILQLIVPQHLSVQMSRRQLKLFPHGDLLLHQMN